MFTNIIFKHRAKEGRRGETRGRGGEEGRGGEARESTREGQPDDERDGKGAREGGMWQAMQDMQCLRVCVQHSGLLPAREPDEEPSSLALLLLSRRKKPMVFFLFFLVKDLDVRVLRREIRLCIFLSFMSYLQGLNYPFNYSFCKGKSEEKISPKCISPLKVKMQTRRYRALWQTSAEGSALAYFAKTFPREPPGRLDAAPGAPTLVIPGGPRT